MTNLLLNNRRIFCLSLIFLFYFVFIDELTDTFLLTLSATILSDSKPDGEQTIAYLLLGLQVICAPLQTGASDGKRRNYLLFSLLFTVISLFLFRLSMLYKSFLILSIAIVLKGFFGNTLPIAWAGIADITARNNIRFFLALSICALAVGSWAPLIVALHFSSDIFYRLTTFLVIAAVVFAIYPFRDSHDTPPVKNEKQIQLPQIFSPHFWATDIKELWHFATRGIGKFCFLSFIFSEISFYQILFRIEMFNNYTCFAYVPLAIGIGYTLGTGALRFITLMDKHVCLIGSLVSLSSIIFTSYFFKSGIHNQPLFITFFALYSFGYALFTPALFSLITPRSHPHLIGKAYGLLESSDSLATLFTLFLIFKMRAISCDLALIISSISILLSFATFFYIFQRLKNPDKV